MQLVVVESPFMGKGDDEATKLRSTERNLRYLRAIMADCFERKEAPYASHGLYTQPGVLRDHLPEERRLGMDAGFQWGALATKRVFYHDLGQSSGMNEGLAQARKYRQIVEDRVLGEKWRQLESKLVVPMYLSADIEARLRASEEAELSKETSNTPGYRAGFEQAMRIARAIVWGNEDAGNPGL